MSKNETRILFSCTLTTHKRGHKPVNFTYKIMLTSLGVFPHQNSNKLKMKFVLEMVANTYIINFFCKSMALSNLCDDRKSALMLAMKKLTQWSSGSPPQ